MGNTVIYHITITYHISYNISYCRYITVFFLSSFIFFAETKSPLNGTICSILLLLKLFSLFQPDTK